MSDQNLDNPDHRRKPNLCVNKKLRYSIYAAVLVVTVGVVWTSYSSSAQVAVPVEHVTTDVNTNIAEGQKSNNSASAALVGAAVAASESQSSESQASSQVTTNDLKSANVASFVASSASISASDNVENSAISTNVTATLTQADSASVASASASTDETVKAVTQYTVKEGEDVATIAAANNVSEQSIRWSNGLKDNNVAAGTVINIPAVDGVIYTVKDGESLQAIADKYQSSSDAIVTLNDIKDDAVVPGEVILLPDGVLPENERPEYVAPTTKTTKKASSSSSTLWSTGTSSGGNTYYYGYCTWYAYNRRVELGLPVSGGWGNANTWDYGAARQGYTVDYTPSVGAIFQTKGGYYGHVGVVEEVYSDGSILVSEMNYKGWNVKSTRVITNLSGYKFIH